MYSDEHRLAVFTVPKVCTYSVNSALDGLGFQWQPPMDFQRKDNEDFAEASMVDRALAGQPQATAYRRASFVRHPEFRLGSAWRWLREVQHHPGVGDFKDFVERLCGDGFDDRVVLWHAGVSQTRHLCHAGVCQVEFVGRFESIDRDWGRMLAWGHLPPVPLPHINGSGPPMDYADLYTPATRALVRKRFQEDYDRWDYA